jgi:hypothetical protein
MVTFRYLRCCCCRAENSWALELQLCIGASQRWRAHIIITTVTLVELTLVEFDARFGRLVHRLECLIPAYTPEYLIALEGGFSALASLEAYETPVLPTRLQQLTADVVARKFGALSGDERTAFPAAIR